MPTNMPAALDTFTAKVDGATTAHASDVNNLQDAVAQLERITVGPTMYNLAGQPNCDPSGSTDSSAGIQAVINSIKAAGGGEMYVTGRFLCASQLNFDGCNGLVIKGVNGPQSANPVSRLLYSGGAGASNFLKATSTLGFTIERVYVANTNSAFNGFLLDLSHGVANTDSSYVKVDQCVFAATGTAAKHLNVDKLISSEFEGTLFSGGAAATSATNYSNALQFRSCVFQNFIGIPIQASTGQAWGFSGCTFEPLASGVAGAFSVSGFNGLTVTNSWLGDVSSTSAASWITFGGNGLTVIGNYVAGNVTGTTFVTIPGSSNFGIVAKNNQLASLLVGYSIGTALNDFIEIGPDSKASVTTYVSGTPKSGSILGVNSTADTIQLFGQLMAGGAVPTLGALQTNVASQTLTPTNYLGPASWRFWLQITCGAAAPTAGSPVAVINFPAAYGGYPVVIPQTTATGVRFVPGAFANGSVTIYADTNLTNGATYTIGCLVVG